MFGKLTILGEYIEVFVVSNTIHVNSVVIILDRKKYFEIWNKDIVKFFFNTIRIRVCGFFLIHLFCIIFRDD